MNKTKEEESSGSSEMEKKVEEKLESPVRRRRGQRDRWPWPAKTVPIKRTATPSYPFRLHPEKNLFTRLCSEGSVNGDKSNNGATLIEGIPGKVLPSHHKDDFTHPSNLSVLERGGVLFRFSCQHTLSDPYERELVESVANLSSFEDECRDNYVPRFDAQDSSEYTFLLTKCSYLLPPIDLRRLCKPSFMAAAEYHESCQPDGTFIWKDRSTPDTFRFTKPIVPHLYNITVQFKVSPIRDPETLQTLSRLLGMNVTCGLLLERTKRTKPPKQDATRKAKSVLLYTVDGIDPTDGQQMILVNHITVVLQTHLPAVVEKVIDKFGHWGLKETCETAVKTRRYLIKTFDLSH